VPSGLRAPYGERLGRPYRGRQPDPPSGRRDAAHASSAHESAAVASAVIGRGVTVTHLSIAATAPHLRTWTARGVPQAHGGARGSPGSGKPMKIARQVGAGSEVTAESADQPGYARRSASGRGW